MPRKGHKDVQIVAVLRQVEAGNRVAFVQSHGVLRTEPRCLAGWLAHPLSCTRTSSPRKIESGSSVFRRWHQEYQRTRNEVVILYVLLPYSRSGDLAWVCPQLDGNRREWKNWAV
jgi:hypothetical protein